MGIQLNEKAMLVKLSISIWTAKKEDKKVTQEVEKQYNAHDAGKYNKFLIAVEEIKKLNKIPNETRTFHYENTLPWTDEGFRILTADNYLPYTQKMREFKSKTEEAKRVFFDNYQAYVDEAQRRLNGLFNPADYPTITELEKKFSFDVSFTPLPDKADFRVNLQADETNRIKEEIETRLKSSIQNAINDLWERLYNVVKHASDKLNDKEAIFRDSLISNMINLVNLLPRLNLTNDSKLEEMRQEVENKLCQVTPGELREDEGLRKETARTCDDIVEKMSAYYTPTKE